MAFILRCLQRIRPSWPYYFLPDNPPYGMHMRPGNLEKFIAKLIEQQNKYALMIWGAPGIGKSSIVRQACTDHNIGFVDIRLSQLMPSDLRGIPVPRDGVTHWYPPSFLPDSSRGILFLDELNMAPPALQGVAQQLILDRKVGDYRLPNDWLVFAAGNQKSDRAAVHEMPAPVANRFYHVELQTSLEDFRQFAYRKQLSPDITAFLSFRPELLHKMHPDEPNWPSPRSWEMANSLHLNGLSAEPAVGAAAATEFSTFIKIKKNLPDIKAILKGDPVTLSSKEPSIIYACITSLVAAIENAETAKNAFLWLIKQTEEEWGHLFLTDAIPVVRRLSVYDDFVKLVRSDGEADTFFVQFARLSSA